MIFFSLNKTLFSVSPVYSWVLYQITCVHAGTLGTRVPLIVFSEREDLQPEDEEDDEVEKIECLNFPAHQHAHNTHPHTRKKAHQTHIKVGENLARRA